MMMLVAGVHEIEHACRSWESIHEFTRSSADHHGVIFTQILEIIIFEEGVEEVAMGVGLGDGMVVAGVE